MVIQFAMFRTDSLFSASTWEAMSRAASSKTETRCHPTSALTD
jgi:hypothetical protein